MALMPRDRAAALGRETLELLRAGGYTTPSGRLVDLCASLEASARGTVEYPPERRVGLPPAGIAPSRISVENQTVLEVGRGMTATGPVAALNFASATHPGGGFLHGARAQEESIARSSGLFHCLNGRPMYSYHGALDDAMYSDYVIYSPNVPVFRNDAGDLLEQPWLLSVLTSPAVHGNGVAAYVPHRLPDVPAVMRGRTTKVLAVAAVHGHRRLILGAWGCGAFGLDSEMMAGTFSEVLAQQFAGAFDEVVFAITDWSPEQCFIGPFRRAFEDRRA
jgi:uncharacterized protein (TIGR02452 family)